MAETRVQDILQNHPDSVGTPVEAVYAKVVPLYAVYRTPERVLIHFADATTEMEKQRVNLTPLNPLRGEINGLINGWRSRPEARFQSRARRFDRRVADALTVALQGDIPGSTVLLERVKQDIVTERTSWARFLYLMIAAAAALVVMVLAGFATSRWFAYAFYDFEPMGNRVWLAAGAGAMGAFFSIATGIRNRTILTDLQLRDNAADAVLRIVIGAIAGALLLLIILSGAISLSIGGGLALTATEVMAAGKGPLVMLLGFAAGFSERMVTDLLAKVTPQELATQARVASATGGTHGAGGAATPAPTPPPTPAPAAAASVAADEEDHPEAEVDGCVSDIQTAEGEETGDAELPPATGGVEQAPSAPASVPADEATEPPASS